MKSAAPLLSRHLAGLPLTHPEGLPQQIHDHPLINEPHLFPRRNLGPSFSTSCCPSIRRSLAFSRPKCFRRFASATSKFPYLEAHRKKVWSEIHRRRHRFGAFAPASCSVNGWMICSSPKRLFLVSSSAFDRGRFHRMNGLAYE